MLETSGKLEFIRADGTRGIVEVKSGPPPEGAAVEALAVWWPVELVVGGEAVIVNGIELTAAVAGAIARHRLMAAMR